MAKAQKIIQVSERGQITLPKKILNELNVKLFTCEVKNGGIVLKPVQTREEFFAELEEREKDWEKNGGGITLDEMAKKYNLK